MKSKGISILLACIFSISIFCSCGTSSSIYGNWVADEVHSQYPDQLIINEDGSGMVDGLLCNWSEKDDTITFVVGGYGSVSYTYTMDGSTLYLDEYTYTRQ